MRKSIEEIEDPDEQEMELTELKVLSVIRGISFFTGIPVDELKTSSALDELILIYTSSLAVIFEEENQIREEIEYEHTWNGEEWKIHPPQLKHGDKLTFGEFIDSRQIIQNLLRLGKGRWECLLPLCAIYLKREGEQYDESFLYEGSDRLRMMENLPMDIAMNVGFFLSSSLTSCITASLYSINQESKEMGNLQRSILKTLGG